MNEPFYTTMALYLLYFIVILAGTAFCNPSDRTPTSCSHGIGLDQMIPMFPPCGQALDQNGNLVQTIAVVVQVSSFMDMKCGRRNGFGVSLGHRICKIPKPGNSTASRQPLTSIAASTATQITSTTLSPTTWPTSTTPAPAPAWVSSAEGTTRLETSSPVGTTELMTSQSGTRQSTSASLTTHRKSSFPATSMEPIDQSSRRSLSTVNGKDTSSTELPHTISQTLTQGITSTAPSTNMKSTALETTPTSGSIASKDTTTVAGLLRTLSKTTEPTTSAESSATLTGIVADFTTDSLSTELPHTISRTLTQGITKEKSRTLKSSETTPISLSITSKDTTTVAELLQTLSKTATSAESSATPTGTVADSSTESDYIPIITDLPSTPITTLSSYYVPPTTVDFSETPTPLLQTQAPTKQPSSTLATTQPDTTVVPGVYKVFVTDEQDKSIIWADLHGSDSMQFSVLRSLDGKPLDVAFDPVEQKVYWSSKEKKKVSRSDLVGGSKETVINENTSDEPFGIVIAVQARYLYCAYESKGWINRVMLGDPDSEERFVEGLDKPKALTIDEQHGYLYWSRHEGIDRKLLNGTDTKCDIEEVIHLQMFSEMNGLTINPDGTRLFFCDENSKQALYLDIGSSSAVVLSNEYALRDVSMDGNGVLYWLESGDKLILVMDDYERSTDFKIKAERQFENPQRIHIAHVKS